jgi:hypothetical protein
MKGHTTQVDAFLPNFCLFAVRQHFEIMLQAASFDDLSKSIRKGTVNKDKGMDAQISGPPFLVFFLTKDDIFANSGISNPSCLGNVRNVPTKHHLTENGDTRDNIY